MKITKDGVNRYLAENHVYMVALFYANNHKRIQVDWRKGHRITSLSLEAMAGYDAIEFFTVPL
jgi:hypothetical protein